MNEDGQKVLSDCKHLFYHVMLQSILPPSTPSLPGSIDSTSSFVAARISVPPDPLWGFRPMLRRALPFARGATLVWRETVRKVVSSRPSAREGGLAKIPACIYDFSALESEMVDDEDIFSVPLTSESR